jgi:hypothetical protein
LGSSTALMMSSWKSASSVCGYDNAAALVHVNGLHLESSRHLTF